MNGLLAIVKNEHDQLMEREKTSLAAKKDEGASSPMSAMTRPISASPTVDYSTKRVRSQSQRWRMSPCRACCLQDSVGEDECGIDVMTVIGMAPSESPSSSGTASSVSEDGPIFNVEVLIVFLRKSFD